MANPLDPVAIDQSKLPPNAARILDPKTPAPLKQMAARGVAPGLKPHEALTIVAILAEGDAEGEPRATALKTLGALPAQLTGGALVKELDPGVVEVVALRYTSDVAMMEKLVALPQMALTTVARVALISNEAVSELIAVNEERLLAEPRIIENLYLNKHTRMSTADRILELAVRNKLELKGIPAFKEAAAAIANELIVEPQAEPTYDDILFRETDEVAVELSAQEDTDPHAIDEATGEEIVKEKFLPIHARIAQMTTSQKIRRATVGTASERAMLVRDTNKLVSQSAIKSPAIQEHEVEQISKARNVPEDVLRVIANSREWTRSHQIKYNLAENPRTPFAFAAKLIPHLRDHELKKLSTSKNVTGAVQTAAKQQISRKAPKGGGG